MRFGIPRAPVRFRVELDGCQAQVFVLKSFNRSVVDICIGTQRQPSGRDSGIDRKSMILGSDEDTPVFEPHRLVCPAVAEFEFIGITAKRKGGDLVAHADPKDGELPEQILDAADCIRSLLGIARPVTDKQGIGFAGHDLIRGGIVRENVQVPVPF